MAQNAPPQDTIARGSGQDGKFIYDRWMESQGVPVHRGAFQGHVRVRGRLGRGRCGWSPRWFRVFFCGF